MRECGSCEWCMCVCVCELCVYCVCACVCVCLCVSVCVATAVGEVYGRPWDCARGRRMACEQMCSCFCFWCGWRVPGSVYSQQAGSIPTRTHLCN